MSTTLVTNIGELVTNDPARNGGGAALRGEERIALLRDAALVIDGEHIAWVGAASDAPDADRCLDMEGAAVIPAFVDSHNHLVFDGDRSAEFAARMTGEPYDGGGIAVSVAATRAASDEELRALLARRVAERIGFLHYVLDYENKFRESVIEEFADAYLAGATPVPCIRCNERVKFRDLLETARELDADCMATGHYIRRMEGPDGAELHMAADPNRDQSYFLFSTTREQLEFLRFPLGGLASKAETRALAAQHGLTVADKPDSQDICFVPEGNYAAVIEKLRPGAADPGDIVDLQGNVLGRHRGVIHYTIGQRRGLGIGGLGDPLYVVRLDPEARHVVVGPREALATTIVRVAEVNWLGEGELASMPEREIAVRIRSTRQIGRASCRERV